MRLRLLTDFAGVGFNIACGEVTERFTGEEAQRIIAAGYAVPATEDVIERAVAAPAPEHRTDDSPSGFLPKRRRKK